MHCANRMEGIEINFFLKETKFNFSTGASRIEAELKEPDRSFRIIHLRFRILTIQLIPDRLLLPHSSIKTDECDSLKLSPQALSGPP